MIDLAIRYYIYVFFHPKWNLNLSLDSVEQFLLPFFPTFIYFVQLNNRPVGLNKGERESETERLIRRRGRERIHVDRREDSGGKGPFVRLSSRRVPIIRHARVFTRTPERGCPYRARRRCLFHRLTSPRGARWRPWLKNERDRAASLAALDRPLLHSLVHRMPTRSACIHAKWAIMPARKNFAAGRRDGGYWLANFSRTTVVCRETFGAFRLFITRQWDIFLNSN